MVLLGLVLVLLTSASAEEEETMDVRADEGLLKKVDMRDFDPGDLCTFELPPKVQMEFFEVIEKTPIVVNVIYLVSSKETNDIDLVIRDPANKPIRQMLKKKAASFKFKAEKPGQYSLTFTNRKVHVTQYMEKLTVTYALHIGSGSEKLLLHEDVTSVESNLMDMHRELGQFRMEQQISEKQQEAHFQSEG